MCIQLQSNKMPLNKSENDLSLKFDLCVADTLVKIGSLQNHHQIEFFNVLLTFSMLQEEVLLLVCCFL